MKKIELFLKKLKWKAFFFLNPDAKPLASKTYGFKTRKTRPTISELKEFEHEITKFVANKKVKHHTNVFQQQLKEDVRSIKNNNQLTVASDKTNNFCKMTAKDYNSFVEKTKSKSLTKKLMEKSLTKSTQRPKSSPKNWSWMTELKKWQKSRHLSH